MKKPYHARKPVVAAARTNANLHRMTKAALIGILAAASIQTEAMVLHNQKGHFVGYVGITKQELISQIHANNLSVATPAGPARMALRGKGTPYFKGKTTSC